MWKVIEGDFIDNEELHAPFLQFYEAFGPDTIPWVSCCGQLLDFGAGEIEEICSDTEESIEKEIPKTVQEFTMHFYLKIDIIRSVVRMQYSYIQKTVFVSEGGCFYAGCL